MNPTETGLVVPVPGLQSFVAEWRPKVDSTVPNGVPAHVTVLYPFLPPGDVQSAIEDLEEFFSNWPSIAYSLDGVGWFGDQVVYVKPLPAQPFLELTLAVAERWNLEPYGGQVDDPQPHVTIGFEGEREAMQRAADAALELLPIENQVADRVWLMQGTTEPSCWERTHEFLLGPRRA